MNDSRISLRESLRSLHQQVVKSTLLLLVPTCSFLVCKTIYADELILRDWSRITNVTVAVIDDDGVKLSDGRIISWDRIESGEVSDEHQADLDQLIRELGEPLFRLRQRIRLGNDVQLLELAESLWPRFRDRTGETAIVVSCGVVRGRLATGQRADAVLPYLVFVRQLMDSEATNELNDALVTRARNEFGLVIDPKTGLCANLLPIWKDQQAAAKALPKLSEWLTTETNPIAPWVPIYVSSLAAFVGEFEKAQQELARMNLANDGLMELRTVIDWQLSLQREPSMSIRSIESNLDKLLPRNRAITLYWLGLAGLKSNSEERQQAAILHLLQIPAVYPTEQDVAAAAIFQVADFYGSKSNDAKASQKQATLRSELLRAYPNSWFAEEVRER